MDAKIVGANAIKVLELLEKFEPHLSIDEKMAILDAAGSILRATVMAESMKMMIANLIMGRKL